MKRTYWQENLRLVAICLAVWFFVSFGCGLLLVDVLNEITFGGFRLGFWFARAGQHLRLRAPDLLLCVARDAPR